LDKNSYYALPEIQNKIAYECRYREVIVIKRLDDRKITIRPLKIFKPEHFQWLYKFLWLEKNDFDLYISNASVKLPPLPNKMKEMENARHRLDKIWVSIMTGYDFFVDLDSSSEKDETILIEWALLIKKDVQQLGNLIDIYKTGSGGVHLILKGQFEPAYIKETLTDICNKHKIPLRSNTEILPYCDDLIYDLRRIRRVPWSIHSKTGKIMEKYE
jgi:hypothetical protein